MRPIEPALNVPSVIAKCLARHLRFLFLRRTARWFLASISVLAALSILFLFFPITTMARDGLIFALLSLSPLVFAWPLPTAFLRSGLRRIDPETEIEALLEAPRGPAKTLLLARAASRAMTIKHEAPPREYPFKGLGRLGIVTLAMTVTLQILAFALTGEALIPGNAPRLERQGSGLRIEGAPLSDGEAPEKADLRNQRDSVESGGVEGSAPQNRRKPDSTAPGIGLSPFSRPSRGQDENRSPDSRERRENEQEKPASGQSEAQEEDSRDSGDDGISKEGSPDSDRSGSPSSQAKGYERSGATGIPSPLLDYRARFFKILGERSTGRESAGDELALGELREYEKRYFDSFDLPSGIEAREEAYAAQLKRRWKELGGWKR